MKSYTAKQLAEQLQQEDPSMNLRTIRYYTQIGMLPPLELMGSRRVYTELHLHHLRAIMALSRSGETLASIQEKLRDLPLQEVTKIGDTLSLYRAEHMLENDIHRVSEDLILSMSPRISPELKSRLIDTVTQLMKGDPKS